MEPHDRRDLTEQELSALLRDWRPPAPPPDARTRIFSDQPRPLWRRLWTGSVRVPVPVAVCAVAIFAMAVWRSTTPVPPRVVIKTEMKTERVEVPVVKERIVTRVVREPVQASTFYGLQPVAELRPRVTRKVRNEN